MSDIVEGIKAAWPILVAALLYEISVLLALICVLLALIFKDRIIDVWNTLMEIRGWKRMVLPSLKEVTAKLYDCEKGHAATQAYLGVVHAVLTEKGMQLPPPPGLEEREKND
jgi:hypothetical protein